MIRKVLFILFLLVPIVNFGVFFIDPEGKRFDIDPEVLLEPAPYAFSIWSVIFIGMILWTYQIMTKTSEHDEEVNLAIWPAINAGLASVCFVPLSLLGSQWLICMNLIWHLISLILLFNACAKIKDKVDIGRWFYLGPEMYLGWISAATAVATALMLREFGLEFSQQVEVTITIFVLLAFAYIGRKMVEVRGHTVSYVLIWALIGLAVSNVEIPKLLGATVLISIYILISSLWALKKGYKFI